jgi:hypothetical protein
MKGVGFGRSPGVFREENGKGIHPPTHLCLVKYLVRRRPGAGSPLMGRYLDDNHIVVKPQYDVLDAHGGHEHSMIWFFFFVVEIDVFQRMTDMPCQMHA